MGYLINLKAWPRKDAYVKKNDHKGIALPFSRPVSTSTNSGFWYGGTWHMLVAGRTGDTG